MEKWILLLKSQKQTEDAHTHAQGEDFSWPRGQEVPRLLTCSRLLALSRLTLGSSAATGKLLTRDGYNCTSPLRGMFATGLRG